MTKSRKKKIESLLRTMRRVVTAAQQLGYPAVADDALVLQQTICRSAAQEEGPQESDPSARRPQLGKIVLLNRRNRRR